MVGGLAVAYADEAFERVRQADVGGAPEGYPVISVGVQLAWGVCTRGGVLHM